MLSGPFQGIMNYSLSFQDSFKFELNLLIFSTYKSTQIGKQLVEKFPNRRGSPFSNIYPVSISDSKLPEECGTVCFVENEHETPSDLRSSLQELFSVRGITLNRRKQNENDQYTEKRCCYKFSHCSSLNTC